MEINKSLIADARSRTPDDWYYNEYVDGLLVYSHGFHTRELAESFKRSVDESVESSIRHGAKRRENVVDKIEPAVGWSVDGEKFSSFSDALLYKWTVCPTATIKGVFKQ